jgi:hypothetical protein
MFITWRRLEVDDRRTSPLVCIGNRGTHSIPWLGVQQPAPVTGGTVVLVHECLVTVQRFVML